MDELLQGLNPQQRVIVEDTEGHVLVLAGAGSGKTRVLTHRIAYLLKNQVKPWRILAVTFTNKAAREMKDRIVDLVGAEGRDVWIGTFHGICYRILARFGEQIGMPKITIIDEDEQAKLLKQCIQLCGFDYEAATVAAFIGDAKNQLFVPTDLEAEARTQQEKDLVNVYQAYEDKKMELGYVDFDDLIMKTVHLFNVSKEVREHYQDQFQYVLSDECQDQNKGQFILLNYFSGRHENLFMVGDVDQSIYKWRGAEIGNMIRFQDQYPNCRIHMLEQNYRSTRTIVAASNALIVNNKERLEKTSFTENNDGDPIVIYDSAHNKAEADFVRDVIVRTIQVEGRSYKDFAVLYRTNRQSRLIESALTEAGVRYQVLGGTSFYDRKEIKDIVAYLRIINNEMDALAMDRIINVPRRGIGDTTVKKIDEYAQLIAVPFPKAVEKCEEIPGISKGTKVKLAEFLKLINELREYAFQENRTVVEIILELFNRTGYRDMYDEDKEEDYARLENIDELLNVAAGWDKENEDGKTLSDFLSETKLVADVDEMEDDDVVTLMTSHSSKGLEFPIIFIVGLEENIFPHARSLSTIEETEEERRLFYVSLTRAEQKAYLSYCRARYEDFRDPSRAVYNRPSRFLSELPEQLVRKVRGG